MHFPGPPSLLLLIYLFGFLPWAAWRSGRRLRAASTSGTPARPLPPRTVIWTSTLLTEGGLLIYAGFVGAGFDYPFFALPARPLLATAAALAALAIAFGLRALLRASLSVDERRAMAIYKIAPRTTAEKSLWLATILVAAVAEEVAYRGVAMAIVWYWFGSPWLAAALCTVAFALAHAAQGRKPMLTLLALAPVFHALVWFTGSLLPAVIVHAFYDAVAGHLINRQARTYDQEASGAPTS